MSQSQTVETTEGLHKASKLSGVTSGVELESGHLGDLQVGNVQVRLATTPEEVRASQALRFRVFYEEYGVAPPPHILAAGLDMDPVDEVCDHLLVIDHNLPRHQQVVGTYRLVRSEAAAKMGQFYTSGEFDIQPILNQKGNLLELGRSCVDIPYRTRPVMQLLWKGIAAYVFHYHIDFMFGVPSFHGIDLNEHRLALSYLYHHHLAPVELRGKTLKPEWRFESLNLLPKEAVDPRQALKAMPPLLKGYLRIGGVFGDGVFVDPELRTIDVCLVVPTAQVTDQYYKHYVRSTREAWGERDETNSESVVD